MFYSDYRLNQAEKLPQRYARENEPSKNDVDQGAPRDGHDARQE